MRIIAGRLGGRTFSSPNSFKTHPMSDKIRGALFNILGDVEGLTILDAFAGSGALSFEAISRGAVQATALDNDRAAQTVIAENIKDLNLRREVTLIKASGVGWLQTRQGDEGATVFDIVLCDPPYDDLQENLITRLSTCVAKDGTLVLSWPGHTELPEIPGFKKVAHRSYGDAQLAFYQR